MIESGAPGEVEAGEETRQINPALLYDAHGGRSMVVLLSGSY